MKIVLVQPRSFHTWEALGMAYLGATLKAGGYPDVAFYSGFFDTDEEIIAGCRDADIIGFGCTSSQVKHAVALARQIKTASNYVVFGGFHPSVLPNETLASGSVDALVVGEGERALLDIINGNRDKIVKAPLVEDLDSLPFPDRRLIQQERTIQIAYRDNGIRIAAIFSSRGCPWACSFCASRAVWTRRHRTRSPQNIVDEIDQLARDWRIDFLKFSDDEFVIDWRQTEAFCLEKIRRGERTPWGCNVRVDSVVRGKDILPLMWEAGCRELWMGIESGSPRILKDIRKGITVEQMRKAFSLAKEIGFKTRSYALLGMPNESYEDIRLTETVLDEIEPDVVGFTILAPFPGSDHYDPKLHDHVDWSQVDEYQNDLTSTKHLSNSELKAEQQRLVRKYQEHLAFRNQQLKPPSEKEQTFASPASSREQRD